MPDRQPPDRQLHDYRLTGLLANDGVVRRWSAEQTSVSRKVLVDELADPSPEARERFIADVRAKASVDHPLIASVYEAVAHGDPCFFAHENLPGPSLENRLHARATLRPLQLAHVVRRISEAQIHLESAGIATGVTEPRHIHLDDHGLIRLDNLARAGERPAEQSARDVAALGSSLVPLVADSQSGTTRMLTLLAWMRGSETAPPLTWEQVREVTLQIEQQLTEPPTASRLLPTGSIESASRMSTGLVVAIVALVLVALAAGFVILRPKKRPPTPGPVVAAPLVEIKDATISASDGSPVALPAFRIAAHEVTIGEYAEFLERLEILHEKGQDRIFDHPDQPATKSGHQPSDWTALVAAAKSGSAWNGNPVTMRSPVVGVDWWDAFAFAEWKKGRLPSPSEWLAALRFKTSKPEDLPASPWQSVDAETPDLNAAGIRNLAGSVTEWTSEPAPDPSNPLGARKWVLVGGSYLKAGSNALSREWLDDRSLRRADLGFRIAADQE